MKKMRKLLAVVLALTVALTMGIATTSMVFAEGEGGETPAPTKNDSITVNNAKAGETYDAYKMFDLVVNDENAPSAYTYKVNSGWAAFFAGEGAGAAYVTINASGAVTDISDAEALAKAAAAWTGKPAAVQSVTVGEGESTAVFTNLEDAYWLITSTAGTVAMTATTPSSTQVTVNEKNPDNTIDKQVKEDSTGTYGEENDAQVGDTVEFKSTVKIVKGAKKVVVHDKMDAGLTYNAGSVAIEGLTKGTEYSVNESPADGDTFDITFVQGWIDGLDFGTDGYKEFTITYTAVLNENAIATNENGLVLVDENNKTKVTYGDGTTSTEVTTTTKTHKFEVYKHEKDKTENLAGAVFSLKKAGNVVPLVAIDETNYRVAKEGETGVETFTTVATGNIAIWGVDSDSDYTLLEVTPPDGFNALTAEVEITVNADNSTRVDVENNTGAELPSTGGIGTTIFYILGALLVIGCGVVLIARRRTKA